MQTHVARMQTISKTAERRFVHESTSTKLRYWTETLGVRAEQLKAAVAQVGAVIWRSAALSAGIARILRAVDSTSPCATRYSMAKSRCSYPAG